MNSIVRLHGAPHGPHSPDVGSDGPVEDEPGATRWLAYVAHLKDEGRDIGYSNEPPLQAIYLVVGVVITMIALGWLAEGGLPAVRRRIAKEV